VAELNEQIIHAGRAGPDLQTRGARSRRLRLNPPRDSGGPAKQQQSLQRAGSWEQQSTIAGTAAMTADLVSITSDSRARLAGTRHDTRSCGAEFLWVVAQD
jgi:hypothetical protein